MNRLVALSILVVLSGCTVCREYPTACKAVAAVAVAGTVIALDHHPRAVYPLPQADPRGPACRAGVCP